MERRKFLQITGLGVAAAATDAAQSRLTKRDSFLNNSFKVKVDFSTGAIHSFTHPSDPVAMNWISSEENAPWRSPGLGWGLGYANLGPSVMRRSWWQHPSALNIDTLGGMMTANYDMQNLRVNVLRRLNADSFQEHYLFENVGREAISPSAWDGLGMAIALPFNDHYTSSENALEHRSHTHIWCGDASSWVATFRMGGRSPHFGLVVKEGGFSSYSVADRNEITSSDTRGTFLFHPSIKELSAGKSYTLAWECFWHNGWNDFFKQAQERSKQFLLLESTHFASYIGETVSFSITGQQAHDARFVSPVPFAAKDPGEMTLRLKYGDSLTTKAVLNVLPPLSDIVQARVNFISTKQQVNDPDHPLYGAYLTYDNELDVVAPPESRGDHNEGRERVGMGVLLARWLQWNRSADHTIAASLQRYYNFVSNILQEPDGMVLDGRGSRRVRLYNWPWVAQLHLEMANLTGSSESLTRFVTTIGDYYARGGDRFYAIGLPVYDSLSSLKKAGREQDYSKLLSLFLGHAAKFAATGVRYPSSEVNFEQSIVAPAAILLLEMHRITDERRWLDAAKEQLGILELFNGRQPDHHLHDVAIRHWDDYWFGKARMWGDTQPHYWSTLTAVAFAHYAVITKDQDYLSRADNIIRNNLSLFTKDGRGSAAFVYPASVNGQRAHFYDALANDQDWALVHALQVKDILDRS